MVNISFSLHYSMLRPECPCLHMHAHAAVLVPLHSCLCAHASALMPLRSCLCPHTSALMPLRSCLWANPLWPDAFVLMLLYAHVGIMLLHSHLCAHVFGLMQLALCPCAHPSGICAGIQQPDRCKHQHYQRHKVRVTSTETGRVSASKFGEPCGGDI